MEARQSDANRQSSNTWDTHFQKANLAGAPFLPLASVAPRSPFARLEKSTIQSRRSRSCRAVRINAIAVAILAGLLFAMLIAPKHAAAQRSFKMETENFIVVAPDPNLVRQVATNAEHYRKELAIEWLGHEIGPWQDRCPITVELARHAGGETSFAFVHNNPRSSKGVPRDWRMKIFGPPDRIVDSVLPHEITHTIFATHFGQPLPRWADEGACTTVEHESERAKNHKLLHDFLLARPSRGIPFNRMFTMRQYPRDILPLYAQGHSLARFLIMKKGKREFVNYISAGLESEKRGEPTAAWGRVTEQFFGHKNLSDLQISWLGWVRDGSHDAIAPQEMIASANLEAPDRGRIPVASPGSNLGSNPAATLAVAPRPEPSISIPTESVSAAGGAGGQGSLVDSNSDGWYVRQMQVGRTGRVAARRESADPRATNETPKTAPIEADKTAIETHPADHSKLPAPFGSGTIWR